MGKTLTKKEAIEFLGLEENVFENYFKNAEEFLALPRVGKGRFMFDEDTLKTWADGIKYRTVDLGISDYARCLDFALAMHFREYVASDFGTGRQREFGQKLTNWIKGQLGEIAVQKFFKAKFGVTVELDFDVHENIVPQDIVRVFDGKKWREPKIGVGIKSTKPKGSFLILGANEIEIMERRSDDYICCRPNIPDDHLLRVASGAFKELVKNEQHYENYKQQILPLTTISCEVVGYCNYQELDKVNEIPGQAFDNGYRYVRKTGLLHKKPDEWQAFVSKI